LLKRKENKRLGGTKKTWSLEQGMKDLEDIVQRLEQEDDLEKSMALYEQGMDLYKRCNKTLNEYESRISMLQEKDGEMVQTSFQDMEE
jgi:exodeoxyribonuclease VII small subunit